MTTKNVLRHLGKNKYFKNEKIKVPFKQKYFYNDGKLQINYLVHIIDQFIMLYNLRKSCYANGQYSIINEI